MHVQYPYSVRNTNYRQRSSLVLLVRGNMQEKNEKALLEIWARECR